MNFKLYKPSSSKLKQYYEPISILQSKINNKIKK